MNDRELLELAAKAAGISHIDYSGDNYDGRLGLIMVNENGRHTYSWDPLNDDGDAFRLAHQLKISISYSGDRHDVRIGYPAFDICRLGDLADIRHEIVVAAAEIGRTMP